MTDKSGNIYDNVHSLKVRIQQDNDRQEYTKLELTITQQNKLIQFYAPLICLTTIYFSRQCMM